MAGTKNYFDQILENQNKLFATLTNYNNTVMEMVMPNKNAAEEAGKLMNDFYNRYFELADKMTTKEKMEQYRKDFWSAFTEDYTKSVELSMDMYRKTAEYYKNLWAQDSMEDQQERIKKMGEIYQESVKAVYDAGTANAKVVQEYLN